jgi:carbon storage regulator
VNESLVIGGEIVVTVLAAKGDVVRLGVQAPHSMPIVQHELLQQVESENQAALLNADSASALAELRRGDVPLRLSVGEDASSERQRPPGGSQPA